MYVLRQQNLLFKFKQKITYEAGAGGTKNIDLMVPLEYSIET